MSRDTPLRLPRHTRKPLSTPPWKTSKIQSKTLSHPLLDVPRWEILPTDKRPGRGVRPRLITTLANPAARALTERSNPKTPHLSSTQSLNQGPISGTLAKPFRRNKSQLTLKPL